MGLNASGKISVGGSTSGESIEKEINGSTFSSPYTSLTSLNANYLRLLGASNTAASPAQQIAMNTFRGKTVMWGGTVTSSYHYNNSPPVGGADTYGYDYFGGFGSTSDLYLKTDGSIYFTVWRDDIYYTDSNRNVVDHTNAIIGMYNLASDPGKSYFTHAVISSNDPLYTSASTYYWFPGNPSDGSALWIWENAKFGFTQDNSSHNYDAMLVI